MSWDGVVLVLVGIGVRLSVILTKLSVEIVHDGCLLSTAIVYYHTAILINIIIAIIVDIIVIHSRSIVIGSAGDGRVHHTYVSFIALI